MMLIVIRENDDYASRIARVSMEGIVSRMAGRFLREWDREGEGCYQDFMLARAEKRWKEIVLSN